MGGVYGTKLYGEVDRVPGLFSVSTLFFHINYVPLFPTGTYVVIEGSHSEESFNGKQIGLSLKSILAGYVRGWSAGVAIFAAGVAGLAGTAFFFGNQGAASALGAFSIALAVAAGFWYVVASRWWLAAAVTYLVLLIFSIGAWWAVDQAISQQPGLKQAKSKEIACFPGLLVAHVAVVMASLTRPLSRCSYERALALAGQLGIDAKGIADRYGEILPVRDQMFAQP